jgi:HK97 family phage major capsid protein
LYANPAVTQSILDDANTNVEDLLSRKVGDKLARVENAAFLNGSGTGKPRGILTYQNGTNWTQDSKQIEQVQTATTATLDFDTILTLPYKLKAQYRARARWAFARTLFPVIRALKDTYGRYLWEPSLQAGMPSSLVGLPIVELNDFPAFASGALVAALADWQESYQIVDRQGIRILRDPYTAKPFVSFYTTKRTGGEVINGDAIKLLKVK